jgi:hypothetical protein
VNTTKGDTNMKVPINDQGVTNNFDTSSHLKVVTDNLEKQIIQQIKNSENEQNELIVRNLQNQRDHAEMERDRL